VGGKGGEFVMRKRKGRERKRTDVPSLLHPSSGFPCSPPPCEEDNPSRLPRIPLLLLDCLKSANKRRANEINTFSHFSHQHYYCTVHIQIDYTYMYKLSSEKKSHSHVYAIV
jgi:hypothetical protein